jgi:hypothetical protein
MAAVAKVPMPAVKHHPRERRWRPRRNVVNVIQ